MDLKLCLKIFKKSFFPGLFFLGLIFFGDQHSKSPVWNGLEKKMLFFGHTEFSDYLDSTQMLSATVDLAYHGPRGTLTSHHLFLFQERLNDLPRLAKEKLGFIEIFFLPALILFFDLGQMETANRVLLLTYDDPKMSHGVFLLHGFLASTVLNDLKLAAGAYRRMEQVPNTPAWIGEFAQKFEAGINPVTASPKVRKAMCQALKTSFPLSALVMAKKNNVCPEDM